MKIDTFDIDFVLKNWVTIFTNCLKYLHYYGSFKHIVSIADHTLAKKCVSGRGNKHYICKHFNVDFVDLNQT